jgi:ubiquinone/menaquinone biosynthesis C-methylase UbiE
MDRKAHWENVYTKKAFDQVSWYREHLDTSMKMILGKGVSQDAAVIDVGGGSSTLVDDLLEKGFVDVTVLDISGQALEVAKKRLGSRSGDVEWIEGDVTSAELPENRFDVWHDRAVFHFLTNAEDRGKYIELVRRAVKPGGHVIIASFGLGGPMKCSGLDVVRYSPDSMHDEFGDDFELVDSLEETHQTPFGTDQEFVYCYCQIKK